MIDSLLAIQKPILLFFQGIRLPLLDLIANPITFFGESTPAIVILLFFYWCVDKKKGFALSSVLLSSTLSMNIFKVIFRIPRPWVKFPDEIITLRQNTATGYSFPSGHSTTASALYGGVIKAQEKKWIKAICISLMILVPLSRVYLSCHWPLDVIFGLILGLLFSLLFSSFISIYEDEKKLKIFGLYIAPVVAILGIILAFFIENEKLEALLWKNLMECLATWSALFIGAYAEKKAVSFRISKDVKKKIAGFIVGIIPGLGIWMGLRSIPFLVYIFKFFAYFIFILYASFIYPYFALKLNIFEKED